MKYFMPKGKWRAGRDLNTVINVSVIEDKFKTNAHGKEN